MHFTPTICQSLTVLFFIPFIAINLMGNLRLCLLNVYRQNVSNSTGETFAYRLASWDVKRNKRNRFTAVKTTQLT